MIEGLPTDGVWVRVTGLVLVWKSAAPCNAKVQATVMKILESTNFQIPLLCRIHNVRSDPSLLPSIELASLLHYFLLWASFSQILHWPRSKTSNDFWWLSTITQAESVRIQFMRITTVAALSL